MDDHNTNEIIHLKNQNRAAISEKANGVKSQKHSIMRSLTRLVVGGILTGSGGLARRLQSWEDRVAAAQDSESSPLSGQNTSETSLAPAPYVGADVNYSVAPGELDPERTEEDNPSNLARDAVIGLIFETQDRIGQSMRTAGRLVRMADRLTAPVLGPVKDSRLLSPVRARIDRLVRRGEQEVQKWVEVGRRENVHSRDLADIALYETVDFWIDYFAESPEVVDLVTSQSISFAEEVVEEVRERTVSADNFLESLVRTVFRRPSRSELPPPPIEVQKEAVRTSKQLRRL